MTEHPHGGTGGTGSTGGPRRIRAGDADRDRVVGSLQAHREAGRLTPEEFEQRMEQALRATWLDELPTLLADLPDERGHDRWAGPRETAATRSAPRGACGHIPFGPVAVLVAVLLVAGSVAAVAHGHFPFPLLWLAVLALWLGPWRRHRAAGRWWPSRRW